MDEPLIITITDVRAAGYCPRLRRWFDDNGIDFRAFLKNGIPAETLLATGDADAERVVAHRLANG